LSDIAIARLESGDPNKAIGDGVIPTKYRRVSCPVVGNIYIWLLAGASDYYFSMAAVNASGPGSIVKIEAKLKSGEWVVMKRDGNYTSARPQERYGTWVVPKAAGEFGLPVSLRFTSPNGKTVEATNAIKSWAPTEPNQDKEMYYIDIGVQF
jgi:expansin (peptidoglycan-binding protein)